jgi:hypothetical protein
MANIIKERWINGMLAIWKLLPASRNLTVSSDEYHATFAHELYSALRLTVGVSNS